MIINILKSVRLIQLCKTHDVKLRLSYRLHTDWQLSKSNVHDTWMITVLGLMNAKTGAWDEKFTSL